MNEKKIIGRQIKSKRITHLLPVHMKEYEWHMMKINRNWSCKF